MNHPRNLTPSIHRQIRERHALYLANTPKRIAEDFNISLTCVYNILRGRTANAHSASRTATQEGHVKPLAKGP